MTALNTKGRCAMNGRIKPLVLDSNVIINFINKKINVLPGIDNTARKPQCFISVVTEMEALANPLDTEAKRKKVRKLLSNFTIVPLDDAIKTTAIEIRRASPVIKLPDAIVAATAGVLGASLVTQDSKLLALQWPSLSAVNIV